MNIYRLLAILNTFGFIGVVVVNYLASSLPINGKTTGELSDAYPNLFVPAGITFAIWGVIYLLLLGFIIYQWIGTNFNKIKSHHFLSRIAFFFFYSCIANISWILLWHYEYVFVSFLVMCSLLGTLIFIYTRLEIGKSPRKGGEFWWVQVPFSVYLGWITIAIIANATALLVHWRWNGFNIPESIWSIILIFVGVYLGTRIHASKKDHAYVLVLIWAFVGIFIKRYNIAGALDYVAIASLTGSMVLLVTVIMSFFQKKPKLTST